jgi:hypothetical protein
MYVIAGTERALRKVKKALPDGGSFRTAEGGCATQSQGVLRRVLSRTIWRDSGLNALLRLARLVG